MQGKEVHSLNSPHDIFKVALTRFSLRDFLQKVSSCHPIIEMYVSFMCSVSGARAGAKHTFVLSQGGHQKFWLELWKNRVAVT